MLIDNSNSRFQNTYILDQALIKKVNKTKKRKKKSNQEREKSLIKENEGGPQRN